MDEPADTTANRSRNRPADRRDADDGDRRTDRGDAGELADRLADVESRLDELEAATQALRGYVGGVRAVNREIEHRADAALAAVERLERDGPKSELRGGLGSPGAARGGEKVGREGTADDVDELPRVTPDDVDPHEMSGADLHAEATDDDVDHAVGPTEEPEAAGIATRLRDVL